MLMCTSDTPSQTLHLALSAGASFSYPADQRFWEAMEVRAFGLFLKDLVDRTSTGTANTSSSTTTSTSSQGNAATATATLTVAPGSGPAKTGAGAGAASVHQQLVELVHQCVDGQPAARPHFQQILGQLTRAQQAVPH